MNRRGEFYSQSDRPCFIPSKLLALCLGLSFLSAADSQAESSRDELTSPRWIWAGNDRHEPQRAFLRHRFNLDKDVAATTLRALADFSIVTFFCNGAFVVEHEDYGPVLEQDITDFVHRGPNVLALRCDGSLGPSAVVVEIEVDFADGSTTTIRSDATWQASRTAQPGWAEGKPNLTHSRAEDFGGISPLLWQGLRRQESRSAISELDDYTQWKRALGAGESSDPSTFAAMPGYEVELLRSARPDEGSWVSVAFDPKGRVVIAREDRGLLRLTLATKDDESIKVEAINDTLKECRGLLFAHNALFANANESKGLYRLRDTDGDDQFDEIKLLYHSGGTTGHGRNDLALGPDGMIYSIHGDAVDLPNDFLDRTSPFAEHRRGVKTREGHLIRINKDGNGGELIAAGLRNPFGIDFNGHGDVFTYDADAEFDMGAPWYRPTRVNHLVPGGDYGWRGVTGSWPPYYPDHRDTAPPNLDIGKGSPTAVKFGTHSSFPSAYRQALFVLDWAYGRILAVHMTPRGASYFCRAETFLRGSPLNVTDLDFGPDGAMYFVTGGRKTQSGLYRVRYAGTNQPDRAATRQQQHRREFSADARKLRQKLEAFHGTVDPEAVEVAWPHLNNADPWIRHAARIAIEHQPVATWRARALQETRPLAAPTALMTLAQHDSAATARQVLERLHQLPLREASTTAQNIALRAYELCMNRLGEPTGAWATPLAKKLGALFPAKSIAANLVLSRMLIALKQPEAVRETMELLSHATTQRETAHYLFVLRDARVGWTQALREAYFRRLAEMDSFQGGEGMPTFIKRIRDDALAAVPQEQRARLAALVAPQGEFQLPAEAAKPRPHVRNWQLANLVDSLTEVGGSRNLDNGKKMFAAAQCIRCHRIGGDGLANGPDLTSVSRRFSRRDLLESILAPSKVVAEQFRNVMIVTTKGEVLTGRVIRQNDYRSPTLRISTNLLDAKATRDIPKTEIEATKTASTSPMPEKLLDTLTKDEILDLLAYIESGARLLPAGR